MRTPALPALFVLLVVPVLVPAQEKKDEDRFQGEWQIVKLEQAGRDYADFVKREQPVNVFTGKEYTFKTATAVEKGTFQLNPMGKIREIDYQITAGEHKGKRQLGIYKFEGETLTLCFGQEGADKRPTQFKTAPDAPEYVLFVLKRKKQ